MKIYTVNFVPTTKAYSFVIKEGMVTVRSFEVTDGASGTMASSEQIEADLQRHGVPFGQVSRDRSLIYPGHIFSGNNDKSRRFRFCDEVCWRFEPEMNGVAACSDRAAWMFLDRFDGGFHAPFNRALEYLPARASKDLLYADRQANSVLTICQPYADSPLEDCTIFVKYSEAMGYHHNLGPTIARVQGTPSPADIWPRIRITSFVANGITYAYLPGSLSGPTISADSYATVNLEVLHPERDEVDMRCNSTLYLEDVDGYCPNLRAKVTQGRASFRVGALGLEPGSKVRVKVGWRNWPGETDFIANVG
jgi:hypothetical protein